MTTSIDPLRDGLSAVRILDRMGDDLMVVNAARESLEKRSEWTVGLDHQTLLSMPDRGLIRHLAMSSPQHWTPFGHPQLQFQLKMPFFVAREWFRHTVGVVRNEVSRRYVTTEPEMFTPAVWRAAPTGGVKQGSGDDFEPHTNKALTDFSLKASTHALNTYNYFLNRGVAPEMARIHLPMNAYTEFWETGSLAFYARVASLRISPLAQKEARLYAQAVSDIIDGIPELKWSWTWLRRAAEKPGAIDGAIRELLAAAASDMRRTSGWEDTVRLPLALVTRLEKLVGNNYDD